MAVRPANDPSVDYKSLVQRGYDQCAAAYEAARRQEAGPRLTLSGAGPELALLLERLPAGSTVLDIGCGAGVPVTRALAEHHRVTGVDISGEQIRRAGLNVPGATLIQGDIMSLEFPAAQFEAVVAFYSIFHLPREEHPVLLRRIRRWLKPGGYLLATVCLSAESGYTEDDFFGVTMYWSNYGLEDYEQMLAGLGFDLLETTVVGHGYADSQAMPAERHPLVFARLAE